MTELTVDMLTFFTPGEAASLLAKLEQILRQHNIESYVVGGFVRDGLLGRVNNDIDVAVAGDAIGIASQAATALRARVVPLNEANQVARVVFPKAAQGWHLDFSALRGTIEEDLRCRDFTINAIAIRPSDIKEGWSQVRAIDPLDGCRDLDLGIVRAVSDDCFRQDPVRLIRAVRLTAMLDFSVEPDTESLIQRDHDLVGTVAAERLRDELCNILETTRAYRSLCYLDHLNLLDAILPELAVTRGVTQPKEHFWNVFDHSLETVAVVERLLRQQDKDDEKEDDLLSSVPWSPEIAQHFAQEIAGGRTRGALLKLAGLLHDIGKPAAKTIERDGRMRFLGHAVEGAEMATRLMERLRFSNREVKMVRLMVEHHMRPGYLLREETPSRRAIYRYFRDTAEAGIDTLYLGLADHLAARGPMLDRSEWRRHAEMTQYLLDNWFQEQTTVTPPKLIDGHILMDKFGLAPGPQIGELLEMIREAQAAGEVKTREEALDMINRSLGRD